MVDSVNADRKSIYLVSKKIDMLGDGAPEFDEVRMRLQTAPSRIAMNCSRLVAHRIGEILRRQNIPVYLMPLRRPHRRPVARMSPGMKFRMSLRQIGPRFRRLSPLARMIMGALVIIGLVLPVLTWKSLKKYSESLASIAQSGELPVLSNREIALAMLDATAEVQFGRSSSLGFFVAPDLLLTQSRCLGEKAENAEVITKNGERFTAWVLHRDDWLGVALLRVAGGDQAFLELGESTFVERGEPFHLLERDGREEIRVREGIVRRSDHFDLGRSYILLDADGASGGSPVGDRYGRVAGIITAGVSRSDGVYAMLPVNYLVDGENALLHRPMPEDSRNAWRRRLEKTAEEDRILFDKARRNFGQPSILRADRVDSEKVDVLLAVEGEKPEVGATYFFRFVQGKVLQCRVSGQVRTWDEFSPGMDDVFLQRRFLWLQRHERRAKLYSSTLCLVTWACPGDLSDDNLFIGFEGQDGIPIHS